jgi:hypothetical protein
MLKRTEKPVRKSIARSSLESELAEGVRQSGPECERFVAVIIEKVIPKERGGPNWAVKGVRYGGADRERSNAALSTLVVTRQQEVELGDER